LTALARGNYSYYLRANDSHTKITPIFCRSSRVVEVSPLSLTTLHKLYHIWRICAGF